MPRRREEIWHVMILIRVIIEAYYGSDGIWCPLSPVVIYRLSAEYQSDVVNRDVAGENSATVFYSLELKECSRINMRWEARVALYCVAISFFVA